MPYWCAACRKYFSVRTGTVMQSSKASLRAWAMAMRWLSSDWTGTHGPLHRELGVTEKTALLLARSIRQATRLPAGGIRDGRSGPGRPRSTTAPVDATAREIAAALFRTGGGAS